MKWFAVVVFLFDFGTDINLVELDSEAQCEEFLEEMVKLRLPAFKEDLSHCIKTNANPE